ncbi:MAG TPA: hypothetical protein DER60_05655 [Syntrophomonas sp.]|nr:hypothetical protein [Syntrophomonas sp.]
MRCPFCRERIPQGLTECPECYESLLVQQPEYCPICGSVWREGNFYCRFCGSRLMWMLNEGLLEQACPVKNEVRETPEGLVLVGFVHRAIAGVLDTVVILAIIGFWMPQAASLTFTWQSLVSAAFWVGQSRALLTVFGLMVLYYTAFEGLLGFTPGKLIAQIKVVGQDGSKIGIFAALLRNLLRIVDLQFFCLVGAVLIWKTPLQQRCGDLAAKTIVVRLL